MDTRSRPPQSLPTGRWSFRELTRTCSRLHWEHSISQPRHWGVFRGIFQTLLSAHPSWVSPQLLAPPWALRKVPPSRETRNVFNSPAPCYKTVGFFLHYRSLKNRVWAQRTGALTAPKCRETSPEGLSSRKERWEIPRLRSSRSLYHSFHASH